jgi:hypothetical protein
VVDDDEEEEDDPHHVGEGGQLNVGDHFQKFLNISSKKFSERLR